MASQTTTEIAATAYSRPWHHMPDMIAQIGAAYVRFMGIQRWIPDDELTWQEREQIRNLLNDANMGLCRATDFFSHEESRNEAFCREEIAIRIQESNDYMDRALDVFRNSDYYREHSRWGWDAFVDRTAFIPAH